MERTLFVGSYTEPGNVAEGGIAAGDAAAGAVGITAVRIGDNGLLTSVRARSKAVQSVGQAGESGGNVVHPGAGAQTAVRNGSVAPVRNASFLAVDGPFVYAVEELADGAVVALHRNNLTVISRVSSGGSDPCHLVSSDGNLTVANYGSGTVAVVPVRGGELAAAIELTGEPGCGPVQDRQASPHAHQVTVTGWGTVLVCDLGADRVDEYGGGTDGRLVLLTSVRLPPGTGPRHLVLIPDGLLVVGELDARLHHIGRFGHGWQWLAATSIVDPSHPALSSADGVYPSHLALSADGSLLYVAIRGRDSISVLDVSGMRVPRGTGRLTAANAGDSGAGGSTERKTGFPPRLLAEVPCGGHWPRHFTLSGQSTPADTGKDVDERTDDRTTKPTSTKPATTPAGNSGHTDNDGKNAADGWLYVANERSHQISAFALGVDGVPEPVPRQQFAINAPACLVVG
ncbi:beta-propeller fold lactonase family protein [Paenarthrobacter sp. Z7-10]|uniref:lactonase family protein n=1 Tax=Paenarthrobacter sp. Z7-10 TaxID=2787635 RepID=UPI0022A969C5|nr:beta-propeller fold lactonase family protein [Paenarthrobacter sp. Z7-10]MCZ2402866.1 beta-propeller fold lactonase family protein [Paenarthrobacter sp. Z7-10]